MLYEKVLEMGNVDFTDTSKLTRDEWLHLRTTGIGGSDAGAIMGLNKYSTPLSVYLAKKDMAAFEGNSATEWGNILEDPIRKKAREDLGIEIETVPGMFTNKDNTFMNANFDGLVFIEGEKEIAGVKVSGLGGHEIKTSRSGEGFTSDEIPDSYYAQVQHYMAVTGIRFFVLTVFIFDKYEGRHYVIPRDEIFIQSLIKSESDFWNEYVMQNVAPAPTGTESESDLVKSLPMAETIELPSECEAILEEKQEIDTQIKELEGKSEALKEQILMKMNELSTGSEAAEKTIATCGGWKISLNTQTSKRIDTAALKKAGIYDEYAKETVSKVLRITQVKG
jgi:putative phage-type endonuclease